MSAFDEAVKKRAEKYDSIKHLYSKLENHKRSPSYACYQFACTTTDPEAAALSAADVALLVDGGNLCFGGRGYSKYEKDGVTHFSGTVHTD